MSEAPFFFLAYAHTPERRWVEKLFNDICAEVFERTKFGMVDGVGFMDRRAIPLGSDWRTEVAQAVATCHVFVPLYSPRYFTRRECGYEWHAFAQRILDHRAHASHGSSLVRPPIVPAIWTPVAEDDLPDVAKRIQMDHADLGHEYAREGFYTLIKNSLYRDQYMTAVQKLALHIILAAKANLRACSVDFGPLHDAFAASGRETPTDRRLTIVVAAPTADRPPGDRRGAFYGASSTDWNPFHPVARQAIADYAAGVAKLHSYEPNVLDFDDGYHYLSAADPSAGPGLLLVDPWATQDGVMAERLHRLDKLDLRWVATMVPWNPQDLQTARHSDLLRDTLRRTLPSRFGDARPTVPALAWRVSSLEQFRTRLPDVLEATVLRYAESVEAHPPAGDDTTSGGHG